MSLVSRWYWAAREHVRTVLFRNRAESEMERELRFHLEMEAEKLAQAEGLSPSEARRRAGVAFGGVERFKEEVRDARGLDWLAGMRLDFVLGIRMLIKHPALTLVGGLGMAVAIAVSVGFFAFVETNIYPRVPLDEGDRIVALENRDVEINNEERQSLHDFVAWRGELRSVENLAAFRTTLRNLITKAGPPEPVSVAEMTAAGFRVARVAPLLGRYLVEDDERDGAPAVVVIGYDVWKKRFEGDSSVVGRDIRFGSTAHTIVGVMPDGFQFPMNHRYWTPLRANPTTYARRQGPAIFIFGRLAPDVTMDEAQAELTVIGRRTAAEFPETNAKLRPMVMPYVHSLIDIQGISTWMVVQMQLMMSLLLVVVALNVSVLIYARTAARTGEIAVRTALGASRRRVIAQLFVEASVLSLGAAAVGLALAQFGVRMGNRLLEMEMGVPFWTDYSLRPSTVMFTLLIAFLAAVIVGVLPALQATGKRLQEDLRQLGGGTRMRLGRTWTVLIVAQVAIAVAALPAAFNMGWTEVRGATTRAVYPAASFLVARLAPEPTLDRDAGPDASSDAAKLGNRLVEVLRRLELEPAVMGATYTTSFPDRDGRVEVEGRSAASAAGHRVLSEGVALDYFDLYGARVRAGRGLGPADLSEGATAVVVNQAFVTQVLGDGPALGRRVRHLGDDGYAKRSDAKPGPWYQIVGVVDNLQANERAPDLITASLYYAVSPYRAQYASLEVRVRTPTTAADIAPKVREIVAAVDPTLRLGTTYSLDQLDAQSQLALRLVALAIGLVLLSVFLLSAAGVYALTSFTVIQRRREIGIRTALGAHPRQVLFGVFARVARQLGTGLALGISAAAVVDTVSGGELMGGHGRTLLPIFGAVMVVVAFLGAVGPARRGLRIQPTEALRGD